MGGPGSLSNTMLLGTTQVSLSNGISFRSTALAGYTSVTDVPTETVTCIAMGGITAVSDAA